MLLMIWSAECVVERKIESENPERVVVIQSHNTQFSTCEGDGDNE